MANALYFDWPEKDRPVNVAAGQPRRSSILSEPIFAEIVLDVQARDLKDRLFTYRVPEFLAQDIFVGAQVLVPFGQREMLGGYVVSLASEVKVDFTLKNVMEVVEPDPLFDKEYIDFLHWLAFRSCSKLQDVISAALPGCLSPRLKRVVSLGSRLKQGTIADYAESKDPAISAIIRLLTDVRTGTLALTTLKTRARKGFRLKEGQFYKALNFLKHEGSIEIGTESTARSSPKLVTYVLAGNGEPSTARHKEILSTLARNSGSMKLTELLKAAGTTYNTVNKLAASGVLQLHEQEELRDPMKHIASRSTLDGNGEEEFDSSSIAPGRKPVLTDDQAKCLAVLKEELATSLAAGPQEEPVEPWLVYGVTGSGKTEIYLRLIEQVLEAGKTALLLVPEISLTPQLAGRLQERFGEKVSVWHSAISDGERYDTWRRLRSGEVSVLLGARSAVLANIPNLGIIILDEEHDASYKQTNPSPRYSAKEVALEKARRHGALVVLGSATPDVVTFRRALNSQHLLELPKRVHSQALPAVGVIDMREELACGNRSILSNSLKAAIQERLANAEQTILLINRRGYASHVFCRACGYVAKCNNCSVSLVYHQFKPGVSSSKPYLACHHCGFERHNLLACPACQSTFIKEYGLGTQKVEETVSTTFPNARVVRLDSDVASRKGAYRDILDRFARGEADILIGTQMVAKGLDIANVTLVGVLAADASLNMPDYRATERGFQLLSQVAGRAGRGHKPGAVILQTYNPELDVIKLAAQHDFTKFFESELSARRAFSYPPFSRLIRAIVVGPDVGTVQQECDKLAEEISIFLEEKLPDDKSCDVQILGPAPCLIERINNRFRHHLIVKFIAAGETDATTSVPFDSLLEFLRHKKTPKQLSLAVDVDALDLL